MIPALEKLKWSSRNYTKLMHLIKLWTSENNIQYSAREKVMGDIGLELSLKVKTGFSIAKVWSMYVGGSTTQNSANDCGIFTVQWAAFSLE